MEQLIHTIFTELRSAWRFRWWGAAIAWVGFLAGLVWISALPNVYEANARVYIDTSSVLRPLLTNQIVPPDVGTQLQFVRQALFGQEKLERVANAAGLDAAAVGPAGRQEVLDELRDAIRLESFGGDRDQIDNVYDIGYRHTNRQTAETVVSTLLNELVEDTLGASRQGTSTAERFLDDEIREVERRLQEAEQRRAEFKRRNADLLPGTEGGYFAEIRRQTQELEAAQKELRLAQSRYDEIQTQLRSESPTLPFGVGGAENEPPPNSIDARIRQYEAQLDQLLLRYTEKHYEVIATRETLGRLREQRLEELRALGITDPEAELSGASASPVYQELQMALNDAGVEIRVLQADIADRQAKLDDLRELRNDVPEVEAELQRLDRDYDVVSVQYRDLVQSRETQQLSERANDADQVEFNIIDQPRAGFEPVAPARLRLLAMSFIAALMAGGGACWLLAQIRPVFSNTRSLREVVGLPVLGVVTQAWAARRRVRNRMAFMGFMGAVAGLAVVFGLSMLLVAFGTDLSGLSLSELAREP